MHNKPTNPYPCPLRRPRETQDCKHNWNHMLSYSLRQGGYAETSTADVCYTCGIAVNFHSIAAPAGLFIPIQEVRYCEKPKETTMLDCNHNWRHILECSPSATDTHYFISEAMTCRSCQACIDYKRQLVPVHTLCAIREEPMKPSADRYPYLVRKTGGKC